MSDLSICYRGVDVDDNINKIIDRANSEEPRINVDVFYITCTALFDKTRKMRAVYQHIESMIPRGLLVR